MASRFLALVLGYKYYLDKDKMTVRRVIDKYGFHNPKEFFDEVGIHNWTDVRKERLIYGDKKGNE